MGSPLKIKEDRSPAELRLLARRERAGRVAARLYAIANALDGMSRAEAARRAGMERQALRDAVLRYNGEDLAGLRDRAKGRPQRRLTEGEEAALAAVILRGPEPERDGCCAWTRGESVSLDGRPFRQDLPPFEHDAGAASNGVLVPEGAPRSPAARHKSPGAVRKKGATRSPEGSGGSASRQVPAESASSRCGFSPTPRPSSRRAAALGTPSPPSRVVSVPCAPILGS